MAESLLHFGGVTIRVNGTGVMRMSLIGLDETQVRTLYPFNMVTSPGKEPTILSNLIQQRARLRMQTTDIDEFMQVNRVILWVNEYAKNFPNGGL